MINPFISEPCRILIVDDDERLSSLIHTYLRHENFEVDIASTGEKAFPMIHQKRPNLIILDINLPGTDGLSVCRKLRHEGVMIPIIMLTARGNEVDRIHGLEIGADDYLTKPFNPRELVARIRAVLRRQAVAGFVLYETDSIIYRFAGFVLDLRTQTLFKNSESLYLSNSEFALLRLLVLGAGKPLSRDQLVASMTAREYHADQRSIDMLVSRLRKRLDNSNTGNSLIRTLRGIGYILVADVSVESDV